MNPFDGILNTISFDEQRQDRQGGVLTRDDLDRMIDSIREQAAISPDWHFLVSPIWMRRLRHMERIGAMYRAYPRPRRKIRKCHMRKLEVRWHECRQRIRKIEQAEIAREEAEMQQLREDRADV